MLIYNPAFDLYHGSFRILRILSTIQKEPHRIESIRIIDFYVLFPHLFANIRLPTKFRSLKNSLGKLKNNYNDVPDYRRVFKELAKFHLATFKSLTARGLIDKEKLKEGFIFRTERPLPNKLENLIYEDIEENKHINDVIEILMGFQLLGNNGLKARTNLMEYKYDII